MKPVARVARPCHTHCMGSHVRSRLTIRLFVTRAVKMQNALVAHALQRHHHTLSRRHYRACVQYPRDMLMSLRKRAKRDGVKARGVTQKHEKRARFRTYREMHHSNRPTNAPQRACERRKRPLLFTYKLCALHSARREIVRTHPTGQTPLKSPQHRACLQWPHTSRAPHPASARRLCRATQQRTKGRTFGERWRRHDLHASRAVSALTPNAAHTTEAAHFLSSSAVQKRAGKRQQKSSNAFASDRHRLRSATQPSHRTTTERSGTSRTATSTASRKARNIPTAVAGARSASSGTRVLVSARHMEGSPATAARGSQCAIQAAWRTCAVRPLA